MTPEDDFPGKPPEDEKDKGSEGSEKPEESEASPFDDVDIDDLDHLGPDTDTELEAEFKEELAGGPPTREYTSEEAAEAAGDAGEDAKPEEKSDQHEWEPAHEEHEGQEEPAQEPTAEEPVEAAAESPPATEEGEHAEEPLDPASQETEVRHPDVEDESDEHIEPAEEPESLEHEAPQEAVAAAAVPLAPTGPTPAQGTMPPGMKPPPGFTPQPDAPDERPPRPHLLSRFFLAAFVVIATFAAATSITILNWASDIASGLGHDAQLQGIDKELASVKGGTPQTILIVGSDRRYGEADRGRSDTTILLRLDPNRDAISLFSIPRDLKVNIPGYGTNKFNAAYAYGGPKLTLKVVKQLTGLNVNHLVNVDFAGFYYAINAIDCVYVDVDHRYYHSNAGLGAAAQYAEINLQPGYQKLCGEDALAYVRYRHLDNDLVRSARQHDFLREARQKVTPAKLLGDRKQLIKIFTRYTSSDIDNAQTMFKVLKLFLAARGSQIKEVHFPADLGGSYVTAQPPAIHTAVKQFLGITGTNGPRADLSAPLADAKQATGKKSKKKKKHKKKQQGPSGLVAAGQNGNDQGLFLKHRVKFPVFYPTQIAQNSVFAQDPYPYSILDAPGQPHFTQSYRIVLRDGLGEYYGIEGTKWPNPPILRSPSEIRRVNGKSYALYFDNDRLRLVAWHFKNGTYWLNNTLLESLTERQMIGIATTAGLYQRKPAQ